MINRRLKLGKGLNCPAFAECSLICSLLLSSLLLKKAVQKIENHLKFLFFA